MITKSRGRIVQCIVVCMCVLFQVTGITAFATVPTVATEPSILLATDRGVASAVASTNALTQKQHGFTMVAIERQGDEGFNVIMNMTEYNKLPTSAKTTIMVELLDGIKGSSINSRDRGRLYSFVENSDTSVARFAREFSGDTQADVARGMAFIRPGMYPVSVILGIVVMGGFALIAVQFGIDLLYCISPMTHFVFKRATPNQHGRLYRFITPEAEHAFDDYLTGGTDVSPVTGLMKSRIIPVFIFAVFSAVLVTGNFFTLLGFFMDLVDNAIRVFFP